jgi:hypothetical protein
LLKTTEKDEERLLIRSSADKGRAWLTEAINDREGSKSNQVYVTDAEPWHPRGVQHAAHCVGNKKLLSSADLER